MKKRMSMAGKSGVTACVFAVALGTAAAQSNGMNSQQPSANASTGMNSPSSMNSMATMNMNGAASPQDKEFLKEAGQGNVFELQTAQLALQKSSSADVKDFAQMIITDHTRMQSDMKPIAAEAGVTPPTGLSGKEKDNYKKLQALSGDAFDKEYIAMMVKDHAHDSKAFGNEATSGQLPDEKKAAMTNKPTIDEHLQKAQALAQAHGVTDTGM